MGQSARCCAEVKKETYCLNVPIRSILMDALLVLLLVATARAGRLFCGRSKVSLEMGDWSHDFYHLDTATIENPPVTVHEGQIYVYENFFPNYTIRYLHVDNLAIKTCGAGASIKAGGINTNGVMIVLHAGPFEEIRSVIDIWGTKDPIVTAVRHSRYQISPNDLKEMKTLKSKYLFKGMRTVNHNFHNISDNDKR